MASARSLIEALGDVGAPIFLASFDAGKARLNLHAPAGSDVAQVKARAEQEIKKTSESIKVFVHTHKARDLASPVSMERWITRFGSGDVVYDPTMIMTRARALVQAAKLCREACGDLIGGLFFDPLRREVFVLHRKTRDAKTASALRARIIGVAGEISLRTGSHITIVDELPRRKLVPVDAASASVAKKIGRTIRKLRMQAAFAVAVTLGTAIPAAAHTGNEQYLNRTANAANVKAGAVDEFGVLAGLSVFGDQIDSFAAAGLEHYFGKVLSRSETLMLLVQNTQRTCTPGEDRRVTGCRDPNEVGQVPGRDPNEVGQTGPGGPAPAGPGS